MKFRFSVLILLTTSLTVACTGQRLKRGTDVEQAKEVGTPGTGEGDPGEVYVKSKASIKGASVKANYPCEIVINTPDPEVSDRNIILGEVPAISISLSKLGTYQVTMALSAEFLNQSLAIVMGKVFSRQFQLKKTNGITSILFTFTGNMEPLSVVVYSDSLHSTHTEISLESFGAVAHIANGHVKVAWNLPVELEENFRGVAAYLKWNDTDPKMKYPANPAMGFPVELLSSTSATIVNPILGNVYTIAAALSHTSGFSAGPSFFAIVSNGSDSQPIEKKTSNPNTFDYNGDLYTPGISRTQKCQTTNKLERIEGYYQSDASYLFSCPSVNSFANTILHFETSANSTESIGIESVENIGPHLLFSTSQTHNGNFGGYSGLISHCTNSLNSFIQRTSTSLKYSEILPFVILTDTNYPNNNDLESYSKNLPGKIINLNREDMYQSLADIWSTEAANIGVNDAGAPIDAFWFGRAGTTLGTANCKDFTLLSPVGYRGFPDGRKLTFGFGQMPVTGCSEKLSILCLALDAEFSDSL